MWLSTTSLSSPSSSSFLTVASSCFAATFLLMKLPTLCDNIVTIISIIVIIIIIIVNIIIIITIIFFGGGNFQLYLVLTMLKNTSPSGWRNTIQIYCVAPSSKNITCLNLTSKYTIFWKNMLWTKICCYFILCISRIWMLFAALPNSRRDREKWYLQCKPRVLRIQISNAQSKVITFFAIQIVNCT